MLFSEWFQIFYDTYIKNVVAYDSAVEYMSIYKKFYKSLYDMELSQVKPLHIQQCINLASSYSNSRHRKVYFLLNRCFSMAVLNDYIDKNPCEKVKPPKRIRKNVQYFASDELKKLFDTPHMTQRMLLLMLYTGLRKGELLALELRNINFKEKYINVCQSLVRFEGGEKIVQTTKSRRDRYVPLNDNALQILDSIIELDHPSDFLFTGSKGQPLPFRTFQKRYQTYFDMQKKKYPDLKYLSPHKLRHTFATFVLRSGADVETVRCLLGHSDITTTQIYVHSSDEQLRQATQKLKFD